MSPAPEIVYTKDGSADPLDGETEETRGQDCAVMAR